MEQSAAHKTHMETETSNQRICQAFVDREVYYCVSVLIHELSQQQRYMDKLLSVMLKPDDETAVNDYDGVHVQYSNHLGGWIWVDKDTHHVSKVFNTREDAYKACAEEFGMDGDPVEAYEHWIISDWLGDKLEAKGEMTTEFMGMTLWGRGTTGQAIQLDGVIREVCSDMEILHGQQNEWKV